MSLTVNEAIVKLEALRLSDPKLGEAVLHLSEDDFAYSAFQDEIYHEPSQDGPGCVLLSLDRNSEVAGVLSGECEYNDGDDVNMPPGLRPEDWGFPRRP